jgi:hypothetical protein
MKGLEMFPHALAGPCASVPPYAWARGAENMGQALRTTLTPSPPTPLPRVQGRGEKSGRYQVVQAGHRELSIAVCLLACLPTMMVSAKESTSPWAEIQWQGQGIVYVPSEDFKQNRVEIRLSDSLSLALEVSGDSGLEVAPIDPNWSAEGWRVSRIGRLEELKGETVAGPLKVRQLLVLDPSKPGEIGLVLPPLRFRDRSSGDQWKTLQLQPIIVHVTTEVLQADLQELRDVAPPEEVPTDKQLIPWMTWIEIVLGSMILVAAAFLLRGYLRRPGENFPPDQWALRELERLDLPGLIDSGQEEKLATLVSDICRRYLDRRYQLGVSSLTTAEFMAGQRSDEPLSSEQQTLARDLLQRCDLAKFARKPISLTEAQQLLDMARTLIQQTSQGLSKPTT